MDIEVITKARALVREGTMSRSGLARAAGLHANSLRRLDEADWNPTVETLGKLQDYLHARAHGTALASAEEIINEARNGRMFILVDDEDRENEGDLVIPAQMATPDAINFMATHGRGLICLALSRMRVEQLGLDLMSRNNGTRHETAFTISIEARDGVTTGISAADRARTISVAIDAAKGREHIVTPGHVFPLVAQDGGVLVRAGHTEAAVDVARLAGLTPAGVICEIMKDDGEMARLDDLMLFAQRHKLKIGTIRDLIAYRRRNDHMIERRAEATFTSRWGGEWRAITFFNHASRTEQIALIKGHISPDSPVLVRMHQISIFSDVFGEEGPRAGLLGRAMEMIAEAGAGIVVVLIRPDTDRFARQMAERETPGGPGGMTDELRNYGTGAQILSELGVHDMILLTNSNYNLIALDGYDLSVVEQRSIPLD